MAVRTTAERIEKMSTIRDQLEDRLAEMTLHPKLNYNVDGQMFAFTDYQEMLLKGIANLDAQINALETSGGTGRLTMSQVFTGN